MSYFFCPCVLDRSGYSALITSVIKSALLKIMNSTLKRSLTGAVVATSIVASFLFSSATAQAQLTSVQVNAIVSLLQSFGADSGTIANVQAALGGSPVTSGNSCTISRNLTVGASGADVVCLQNILLSKGFSVPAGATGFFGVQTQTAVAAFQRAQGISPSVGYVGPVTRAAIDASGYVPVPTPTPSPVTKEEGELKRFSTIGDVESEVKENERNVKVLGVEFDAEDSNMRIDRVDVEFEKVSGAGSTRLERYVSSVSLYIDGKKVATQSVSRSDRDGNIYSFRFSGINAMVEKGKTGELYVAVDVVNNIDSADEDAEWAVRVPVKGIRATDTAGISDTYGSNDLSETVTFGEETTGSLRITSGDDNPDDEVVIGDDSKDTNGVALLEFEIKGRNQDIELKDIPVSLAISGNVGHVGEVVKTLKLMQGSKVLKSKNIPANAGVYEEIVFDKLDITVAKDSTETFKVVADIRKISGTFHEGDSVTASTTASLAWGAEDNSGNDIIPTGSVTGGTQYFYISGISAKIVSVNATKNFRADDPGEADRGEFKLVFDVTAIGDDIYLDRSVTRTESGVAGDGFTWATTSDSTTGNTLLANFISASNTDSGDTDNHFKVGEGKTRRFTMTVILEADQHGAASVMLTGINWTTDSSDTTPDNFYTVNLGSFKTDLLTLFKF